jgi:hypothetical protein
VTNSSVVFAELWVICLVCLLLPLQVEKLN